MKHLIRQCKKLSSKNERVKETIDNKNRIIITYIYFNVITSSAFWFSTIYTRIVGKNYVESRMIMNITLRQSKG